MPKHVEKRFGAIAIDKGFITAEQLVEALALQVKENVELGQHRLLGQILLKLGYITEAQIEAVLETISQTMLCTIGIGR